MSQPRVLIVDDSDQTAEMLCMMLGREYDSTPATSGAEALRLYWAARTNKEPFDLLVLDLAMPEVSGFDVAKQVRESDQKTLIAFLTAFRDPETPGTAEELGVAGICHKPIEPKELQEFVAGLLTGA